MPNFSRIEFIIALVACAALATLVQPSWERAIALVALSALLAAFSIVERHREERFEAIDKKIKAVESRIDAIIITRHGR